MGKHIYYYPLIFCLGITVTLLYFNFFDDKSHELNRELTLGQREFINPLLDCSPMRPISSLRTEQLEKQVKRIIDKHKRIKTLKSASVYFRDLNTGRWFGINKEERFIGASLLKVPVLIEYLNLLSLYPNLMEVKIKYDSEKHNLPNISQILTPPDHLEPGVEYSVDYLLGRMIALSDNVAATMLLDYFPDLDIVKTLEEMGIKLNHSGTEAWITVNEYASLFRILYNSTYLSKQHSNAALQLLAQSHFKDGIEAGIEDQNIVISHKFGERVLRQVHQFHDCGIVYYPQRPYLICIMTRGPDIQKLLPVVAEISRTVFQAIDHEVF